MKWHWFPQFQGPQTQYQEKGHTSFDFINTKKTEYNLFFQKLHDTTFIFPLKDMRPQISQTRRQT